MNVYLKGYFLIVEHSRAGAVRIVSRNGESISLALGNELNLDVAVFTGFTVKSGLKGVGITASYAKTNNLILKSYAVRLVKLIARKVYTLGSSGLGLRLAIGESLKREIDNLSLGNLTALYFNELLPFARKHAKQCVLNTAHGIILGRERTATNHVRGVGI